MPAMISTYRINRIHGFLEYGADLCPDLSESPMSATCQQMRNHFKEVILLILLIDIFDKGHTEFPDEGPGSIGLSRSTYYLTRKFIHIKSIFNRYIIDIK